jgi:hypothetical protein
MTKAESFFMELIEQVPDAKPGKMFGALCMKMPNGKSGAMFWKDNIVVKLKGDLYCCLLNLLLCLKRNRLKRKNSMGFINTMFTTIALVLGETFYVKKIIIIYQAGWFYLFANSRSIYICSANVCEIQFVESTLKIFQA